MSVTVRQASLEQLESVIERGVQTFVEVGLALMEVRDRRLYKEAGYTTFEKYCTGRWQFGRRHANRLIEAAGTVQALSDDNHTGPIGPVPATESQARELTPLAKEDPDKARAVWREVNEPHNGKVTAAKVKQVVQRVRREPDPEYVDAEYVDVEPDPRIPDLKAAIQLLEPLYQDYSDSLAPTIRAHTAGLRSALRRMQEETEGI